MSHLYVVILAAGMGKRMKSASPKVLHAMAGRPIIEHVLRTARTLQPAETIIVVGHGAAAVQEALASYPGLTFVTQSPQLGTGHAVQQTEPVLRGKNGSVLVLYGDVPLLESSTLSRLFERHRERGAAATLLTTELDEPYGYGRIVRDESGLVVRIVEERDASAEQRRIREINSGMSALSLGPLFDALSSLAADNSQGEYYLTDLVGLYRQRGLRVETISVSDPSELRGVNTRVDLAELTGVVRARKRRAVMLAGATLEDPASVFIDEDVEIGADTIIGPNVILSGRTAIGARARIQAGTRITDSSVGDDATILDHCVIDASTVAGRAIVGPFARLRPKSDVGEGAHIGNFVEMKNTRFGAGSKAGHLSYLGDATIGRNVNIGAGTITCNYDGERKHPTIIEDGVFVGSDTQIIAPVKLGRDSYVAAGSCVTEDVPPGSLAVARARQTTKQDWASTRRPGRRPPAEPDD